MTLYTHFQSTGFGNSSHLLGVGIEDTSTGVYNYFKLPVPSEVLEDPKVQEAVQYCGYTPGGESSLEDVHSFLDALLDEHEGTPYVVVFGTFGRRFIGKVGYERLSECQLVDAQKLMRDQGYKTMAQAAEALQVPYDPSVLETSVQLLCAITEAAEHPEDGFTDVLLPGDK